MIEDFPIPSSRQLKAIRSWFGVPQTSFAGLAGISATTLVVYEKGNPVSPETLEMIARQCGAMGVTFRKDGAVVLPQ